MEPCLNFVFFLQYAVLGSAGVRSFCILLAKDRANIIGRDRIKRGMFIYE